MPDVFSFIRKAKEAGYSKEEVRGFLIEKGHDPDDLRAPPTAISRPVEEERLPETPLSPSTPTPWPVRRPDPQIGPLRTPVTGNIAGEVPPPRLVGPITEPVISASRHLPPTLPGQPTPAPLPPWQEPRTDFQPGIGKSLKAGIAGAGQGLAGMGQAVADTMIAVGNLPENIKRSFTLEKPLTPQRTRELLPVVDKIINKVFTAKEFGDIVSRSAAQQGFTKNIGGLLDQGSYLEAGQLLGYSVLENLPQQAIVWGGALATGNPALGAAALSGVAGGKKYVTMDPSTDMGIKLGNATLTGLGEFITENYVGTGDILRRISKAGKEGVKTGFKVVLKEGLKSTGQEATEEVLAKASEDFVDLVTGVRQGNFVEIFKDGLFDQAVIGGITGGILGTGGTLVQQQRSPLGKPSPMPFPLPEFATVSKPRNYPMAIRPGGPPPTGPAPVTQPPIPRQPLALPPAVRARTVAEIHGLPPVSQTAPQPGPGLVPEAAQIFKQQQAGQALTATDTTKAQIARDEYEYPLREEMLDIWQAPRRQIDGTLKLRTARQKGFDTEQPGGLEGTSVGPPVTQSVLAGEVTAPIGERTKPGKEFLTHRMPDGSVMAGPEHPGAVPDSEKKTLPLVERVDGSETDFDRDNILLAAGRKAVPGIRLQEAREAGRMQYLVEKGELEQSDFDEWKQQMVDENRVTVPKAKPGLSPEETVPGPDAKAPVKAEPAPVPTPGTFTTRERELMSRFGEEGRKKLQPGERRELAETGIGTLKSNAIGSGRTFTLTDRGRELLAEIRKSPEPAAPARLAPETQEQLDTQALGILDDVKTFGDKAVIEYKGKDFEKADLSYAPDGTPSLTLTNGGAPVTTSDLDQITVTEKLPKITEDEPRTIEGIDAKIEELGAEYEEIQNRKFTNEDLDEAIEDISVTGPARNEQKAEQLMKEIIDLTGRKHISPSPVDPLTGKRPDFEEWKRLPASLKAPKRIWDTRAATNLNDLARGIQSARGIEHDQKTDMDAIRDIAFVLEHFKGTSIVQKRSAARQKLIDEDLQPVLQQIDHLERVKESLIKKSKPTPPPAEKLPEPKKTLPEPAGKPSKLILPGDKEFKKPPARMPSLPGSARQRGAIGRQPPKPAPRIPESRDTIKANIRRVQTIRNKAGISDREFVEIKKQVTGKSSLKQMTLAEIKAVGDAVQPKLDAIPKDLVDRRKKKIQTKLENDRARVAKSPILAKEHARVTARRMKRGLATAEKMNARAKEGKPALTFWNQYKDVRYLMQDLQDYAESQGKDIPFYRMFQDISEAKTQADKGAIASTKKYMEDSGVELKKIADPGFAKEVELYINTEELGRTKENYPDKDVRNMGEALIEFFRHYAPETQTQEFLEWYSGKGKLPGKATEADMQELKTIIEEQSEEAVRKHLEKTKPEWGLRQNFGPVDHRGNRIDYGLFTRKEHQRISRGHAKSRSGPVTPAMIDMQNRTVFERANAYARNMEHLKHIGPFEGVVNRGLREAGLDHTSKDLVLNWFDIMKGFPIRMGPFGKAIRTLRGAFYTRVLLQPKWAIRNFHQNMALLLQQLRARAAKYLLPGAELPEGFDDHFKDYVRERKPINEVMLLRAETEQRMMKKYPRLDHVLKTLLNISLSSDDINRFISFRMVAGITKELGQGLLDGEIDFKTFGKATGYYSLEPAQQEQILILLADGQVDTAAKEMGTMITENTHWRYDRSKRGLAEMTPDGVVVGELLTWAKGMQQKTINAGEKIKSGNAQEKWAGTKIILGTLIMGALTNELLENIFGKQDYEDYGYGSLLWVPGGPTLAQFKELGNIAYNSYIVANPNPGVSKEDRKKAAIAVSRGTEFLGRAFVPFYRILLNSTESAFGKKGVKPLNNIMKKWLRDDSGIRDIERDLVTKVRHGLFGTEAEKKEPEPTPPPAPSIRNRGRDFPPRSRGRDLPPRSRGRDLPPRSRGRDLPPRSRGRTLPSRNRRGN